MANHTLALDFPTVGPRKQVNLYGVAGPFDEPVGATDTKAITGIVRDVNSDPVEGATVLLFRQSDNFFIASTTTDASGLYSFPRRNDDEGEHFTVAFTVGSGGTTQVHGTSDLGLVPA